MGLLYCSYQFNLTFFIIFSHIRHVCIWYNVLYHGASLNYGKDAA